MAVQNDGIQHTNVQRGPGFDFQSCLRSIVVKDMALLPYFSQTTTISSILQFVVKSKT